MSEDILPVGSAVIPQKEYDELRKNAKELKAIKETDNTIYINIIYGGYHSRKITHKRDIKLKDHPEFQEEMELMFGKYDYQINACNKAMDQIRYDADDYRDDLIRFDNLKWYKRVWYAFNKRIKPLKKRND